MGVGLRVRTLVYSYEFIGTRTSALFGELSRDGVRGVSRVGKVKLVVSGVGKGKHQGSRGGVHFACGRLCLSEPRKDSSINFSTFPGKIQLFNPSSGEARKIVT